jgi:hypothetical protein
MHFDNAFAAMAESKVEAVVATQDGEFAPSFGIIARLCTAKKLPSISSRRSRQRLSNRSVRDHRFRCLARASRDRTRKTAAARERKLASVARSVF